MLLVRIKVLNVIYCINSLKGRMRTLPQSPVEMLQGSLFPMCGMNLAFNRELIGPAMYFGLMGEGYPIGRYDDMWAGWCVKVNSLTDQLLRQRHIFDIPPEHVCSSCLLEVCRIQLHIVFPDALYSPQICTVQTWCSACQCSLLMHPDAE